MWWTRGDHPNGLRAGRLHLATRLPPFLSAVPWFP
jgi:hypothetical protein